MRKTNNNAEEASPINVKALRAKFQEEALLAQPKASRPNVAEKPKHLQPPGGHWSSVVRSINAGTENKTAAAPRLVFRDGPRASEGKRTISFPPQLQHNSPSPPLANGEGTRRQALKDQHMPRVLPGLPVKEQRSDFPAQNEHKQDPDPVKDVLLQTKIKKKGLLLPFRSSKVAKVGTECGAEPTYAHLSSRPSNAPGELPSVEKQTPENGFPLRGSQSTSDFNLSSPDPSTTPPSAETSVDSENKIISTFERAKKKFSQRHMLISTKAKNQHSPDFAPREKVIPSPPKSSESVGSDGPKPPPVGLPHLACISARPFIKANNSAHKSTLDKHRGKVKVTPAETHSHPAPAKKPLPDLRSLGPVPAKPPRPPSVDLSRYRPRTVGVLPVPSRVSIEEPASEHPSICSAVLEAPDFPDFENSEIETSEEDVDIAAIELEALDVASSVPKDFEVSDFDDPQIDSSDSAEPSVSSVVEDLNLGSPNIIPLDPASFPEPINLPDEWSTYAVKQVNSPADETRVSAAECNSAPEEHQPGFPAAVYGEGLPQAGVNPHGSSEACDNVYEDVKYANKFILNQNLRKHKAGLKNPYADKHPTKEDAGLNIWPRNPWGSVTGEPSHSPSNAEHKEQKKREKQRLEREKKEQKERERKENEMKKKFKVTGDEIAMYQVKVRIASKVRKNDLPVISGDTVSIIRTTNCPKGKWLARDDNHKYGYISVTNVELNIREMMELGKKAQAAGRGGTLEGDTISIGSRSSSHPVLTSSFTDDSEEWACEDETLSPSFESHSVPQQMSSVPETTYGHTSAQHTLSDANLEDLHTQTRHEALQKLAIFFEHSEDEFADFPDSGGETPTSLDPPNFLRAVEEPPYPEREVDLTELELLPPPLLYADTS